MEDKAIRGVRWTFIAYAVNKGIRILSLVVLARLLAPSDFGLVALALAALAVVNVFSDLGLGAVLVVRQDLDRRAMGTVLSLMLITGAVAAVLVAATAPLIASALGESELTAILVVFALLLVINVFGWFYEMVLQRELEFRKLFACNVAQTGAYVSVTLSLAVAGAEAWSLVAGELASGLTLSAALLIATPYRVAPTLARERIRELFSAGWGFLVQGGLAFVQDSADRLIVGRALGTVALGYYSMAFRLGEMPYWALGHPVIMVTFPGFARMRDRGEEIAGAFLGSLRLVAVLVVPVGVLLSAAAEPIVRALLGEQWIPAIGVIAIMGIWSIPRTLGGILAWLLNSLGESALLAKVTAATLAPLVPAIVVAASVGGIEDVAWVVLANAVLSTGAFALCIAGRAGVSLRDLWGAVRAPVLAGPVAWLATTAVSRVGDGWPAGATLAAAVLAGLAAFAVALAMLDRSILTWIPAQVRRALEAERA